MTDAEEKEYFAVLVKIANESQSYKEYYESLYGFEISDELLTKLINKGNNTLALYAHDDDNNLRPFKEAVKLFEADFNLLY